MEIALCLYGYYNNRADPLSGDKGFDYIKKTVYPHGNVDVFFHSWEPNREKQLVKQFRPKDYVIERQLDFTDPETTKYIDQGFKRAGTTFAPCNIASSLSFFHSRGKSIQLMEWSQKDYDVAIVCRFDLGQRSKKHRGYNVSLMNFNPKLNMDYIYSSMWVQTNAGYADQWFFSKPENISKLRMMYTKAKCDYFRPGSDYEKAITQGWFDSNANDEFSNERFKKVKTKNLVKYPRWQMINNHVMHKWFFKDMGLYDISRFV